MGYNLCPHRHSALDGHPRLLRAAPQARASHTPQLRWPDPHHRPAEPGIERSLPLNTSRVKTRHSRALSHTHTHGDTPLPGSTAWHALLPTRSCRLASPCQQEGRTREAPAHTYRSAGCPRWRGPAARRRSGAGSPRTRPGWTPWPSAARARRAQLTRATRACAAAPGWAGLGRAGGDSSSRRWRWVRAA